MIIMEALWRGICGFGTIFASINAILFLWMSVKIRKTKKIPEIIEEIIEILEKYIERKEVSGDEKERNLLVHLAEHGLIQTDFSQQPKVIAETTYEGKRRLLAYRKKCKT